MFNFGMNSRMGHMSIITLLSDWGLSSYYVAAVKARLYSECPTARIVDISHQIPRFSLTAGAFVLQQTYPYFPVGTIHCIGLNDIASSTRPHIIVQEGGQYFIGADNGLFHLMFDRRPTGAWRIVLPADGRSDTFPAFSLFPLVAAHLAQGGHPDEIGEPYDWNGKLFNMKTYIAHVEPILGPDGTQTGARINGSVIYTDDYGNCVTNISRTLFDRVASEFPHFEIRFRGQSGRQRGQNPFNRISRVYGDVGEAELCALFPEHQLLEIAMNRGSVVKYCGLMEKSPVYIDFTR